MIRTHTNIVSWLACLAWGLMGPRLVRQLGLHSGTSRAELMATLARSVGGDDSFVQEVLRVDRTKAGQTPDLVEDPLVRWPMGPTSGGQHRGERWGGEQNPSIYWVARRG